MAVINYPAINYSALVDSWQEPDPYLDPITTDMEGGNKRMRSRPGDNVSRVTFNVLMTNAHFATFKAFVITTLGNGTARFYMNVWLGTGYENRLVQFASKFKNDPVPPGKTMVGFDLWVYPS